MSRFAVEVSEDGGVVGYVGEAKASPGVPDGKRINVQLTEVDTLEEAWTFADQRGAGTLAAMLADDARPQFTFRVVPLLAPE
jgi:hypothetical protein